MLSRSAWMVAAAAGLALGPSLARGQDVTNPGDPVTPSSANSPAAELAPNAIDNTANTKYLNFDIVNTGFTVTPSGTGIVHAITLITANDQPGRDPTSFTLSGSLDGTTFTPIASGTLAPPTTRFSFYQATFANSTAYTQYQLVFPTISNSITSNSMQIAEVQFNVAGNILTPGDGLSTTYTSGASSPAGQGAAGMIDGQLGMVGTPRKFAVTGGNLGPTSVDITPAVGASIITGFDIFSDEVGNGAQTPASVTISGSNNGVTFTQIFTSPLAPASAMYQDQQFSFANTTSYSHYRLTFGASSDTTMSIGEIQLFGNALGAAPGNDACASAQNVSDGSTSASTINATGTAVASCTTGDPSDVWFRYTASVTGNVEVNTCGAGTLDTTLAVFASCGGAQIGCNDNACLGKSRVRFVATSGTAYLIRVAGVGGATGSFTLNIVPNPVIHNDVAVPLAYNFNGMVHPGEGGMPDNLTGYRSLSDRGFLLTGAPGSIEVGQEGVTGIPYTLVDQPFVLDLVQLGNRDTVDNGSHVFDTVVNGDITGVQPTWLTSVDQTGPQTTQLTQLGLAMGPDTQVGILANASNGGTSFLLTLNFTDMSSAAVFVDLPDWFGSQAVGPAESGVASQAQLGTFFGASQVDQGTPDVALNAIEAIVSTSSLNSGGIGDFSGKQLASITFSNSTSFTSDMAVYAVTIRDGVSMATPGVCCRGSTCNASIAQGSCTASGAAGAVFASTSSACNSGSVSNSPCCYADYNKANGITVQDIFDFLSDWFAGSAFAKVGGDGTGGPLAVQNIFDFLTNWFNGGC